LDTHDPQCSSQASSSARDTDWHVRLVDVHPDGAARFLCHGMLRARFRESFERPTLLTPNKETSLTVKLWGTSNLFKKGHRIRVHITSSNFPRYNRNLNSGKAMQEETEQDIRVANQTIYHTSARASAIILPIVGALKAGDGIFYRYPVIGLLPQQRLAGV
jgi:hypothetical protein